MTGLLTLLHTYEIWPTQLFLYQLFATLVRRFLHSNAIQHVDGRAFNELKDLKLL